MPLSHYSWGHSWTLEGIVKQFFWVCVCVCGSSHNEPHNASPQCMAQVVQSSLQEYWNTAHDPALAHTCSRSHLLSLTCEVITLVVWSQVRHHSIVLIISIISLLTFSLLCCAVHPVHPVHPIQPPLTSDLTAICIHVGCYSCGMSYSCGMCLVTNLFNFSRQNHTESQNHTVFDCFF